MAERLTRNLVEFMQPFELSEVEGLQPPGIYEVETVEEEIGGLSFIAYRRVSTSMTLPASNRSALSHQHVAIDPVELAAALAQDKLPIQERRRV